MKILVSACLLGVNCRYSGTHSLNPQVVELAKKHELVPVCPEQLGGLPTPRQPAELLRGRAIDRIGTNVTPQFDRGADEAVKLAKTLGCTHAVLKSRSPSCGPGWVYDGTFSGNLVKGNGILVKKLQKAHIKVTDETHLEALLE